MVRIRPVNQADQVVKKVSSDTLSVEDRKFRFDSVIDSNAKQVCFRAPCTALATSVTVSFGVWCGGGLGKQRWKREEAGLWVFCISLCVWRLERDLSDKDDVAEIYWLA